MEEIDKMKIQIAKLEGFTIGLAESLHRLVQAVDTLDEQYYRREIKSVDESTAND